MNRHIDQDALQFAACILVCVPIGVLIWIAVVMFLISRGHA